MLNHVIIIGAGIAGCSVARECARYQFRDVLVLEKEADVCEGATKANSGIVHAGFDAYPGSLKAKYNRLGNEMYHELEHELGLKMVWNGSLVLCLDKNHYPKLEDLLKQAAVNQIAGCRIIDRETVLAMEPKINPDIYGAFYAPGSGLCDSFEVNIALAENAAANHVAFRFNHQVTAINRVFIDQHPCFEVVTDKGIFHTEILINCAGYFGDEVNRMIALRPIDILPRRGEYYLLDKTEQNSVHATIFQLPSDKGKGILVAPTVSKNIIIGPNAESAPDKNNRDTTEAGLEEVKEKALMSVPSLRLDKTITTFSGIRATARNKDFILGEDPDTENYFVCIGIDSPGLTSAPALGRDLACQIAEKFDIPHNPLFNPIRPRPIIFSELSRQQQDELVHDHPAYGHVVCRCETITEGEIKAALHRQPAPTTLDGIKRRTRAGSGRCQAGFCLPKVMEILAREYQIPLQKVTKSGSGSELIVGNNKDGFKEEYHD